ncbi:hypothetical protein [Blackfly microvirus SF02]|uniref:Uncharacterized protein n=1 Tax=Blackfly microvirus SF02 TaxID=2576452 RepID=A0A4P8PK80_9VIRU|nr:hypothetical protein [Blackfly microvirus SF02]
MSKQERRPWPSDIKWAMPIPNKTSPNTPCVFTLKTFLVCLCAAALGFSLVACSGNNDVLVPNQGLPVAGENRDRGVRDNVQSSSLTCRGFIVLCAVWEVPRMPSGPLTRLGAAVYARGSTPP